MDDSELINPSIAPFKAPLHCTALLSSPGLPCLSLSDGRTTCAVVGPARKWGQSRPLLRPSVRPPMIERGENVKNIADANTLLSPVRGGRMRSKRARAADSLRSVSGRLPFPFPPLNGDEVDDKRSRCNAGTNNVPLSGFGDRRLGVGEGGPACHGLGLLMARVKPLSRRVKCAFASKMARSF